MDYMIRGITKEGKEVFYTGRAGEGWVHPNPGEAFRPYSKEGAQRKAAQFNRMTAVHGVRFVAFPCGDIEPGYFDPAHA